MYAEEAFGNSSSAAKNTWSRLPSGYLSVSYDYVINQLLQYLGVVLVNDTQSNDARSCINYANMLTLHRDNPKFQEYKCDMQRPVFLGEENKPDQRSCFFWKLLFSVLIFSNENNIAKLVGDAWGNCFSRLCQLLCNWIRMNLIFKSSRSQMFYKISVLKKFANFAWKQLRPVTLLKRASNAGIFLTI